VPRDGPSQRWSLWNGKRQGSGRGRICTAAFEVPLRKTTEMLGAPCAAALAMNLREPEVAIEKEVVHLGAGRCDSGNGYQPEEKASPQEIGTQGPCGSRSTRFHDAASSGCLTTLALTRASEASVGCSSELYGRRTTQLTGSPASLGPLKRQRSEPHHVGAATLPNAV